MWSGASIEFQDAPDFTSARLYSIQTARLYSIQSQLATVNHITGVPLLNLLFEQIDQYIEQMRTPIIHLIESSCAITDFCYEYPQLLVFRGEQNGSS